MPERTLNTYRRDKHNYYLDIAEVVAKRGSCLRRNFGAVIVNHDQIISSGYTGAPRGRKNCPDLKECRRDKFGIPRGERYEFCRSVHAEANAVIHTSRKEMLGSVLYLAGMEANNSAGEERKEKEEGKYVMNASPCEMCKRLIINSGISKVIIRQNLNKFHETNVKDWIENDDSITEKTGY
jgi:dCMP deaminase